MHARKSFLYLHNEPWVKKNLTSQFDVTMGSFDGAEICEIVGIYLMNELSKILKKENIGLYRDDGLAVIKTHSGRQIDVIRKKIIEVFKSNGLQITIETNLTITDFLDVTLDLNRATYYPFRKPNDTPLFLNKKSNHPPGTIKHLSESVSKRLSSLSMNETEFEKAKVEYESSLKRSGFNEGLKFTTKNSDKRKRKRKIIWFNPPFNSNVQTNVAKQFINLIKKHFPSSHKYYSIFNSNTVKVSYSCMPNMDKIITSHNKKLLKCSQPVNPEKECNCRESEECPLDGNCQQRDVVYKATVKVGNTEKCYIGLCEGDFKRRYNNHTTSFKYIHKRSKSELANYIWDLKLDNKTYSISWSIIGSFSPYTGRGTKCNLCIAEKFFILHYNDQTKQLLNHRDELINKCRHTNKYLLKYFKT